MNMGLCFEDYMNLKDMNLKLKIDIEKITYFACFP